MQNYHLQTKVRWGEKKWAPRLNDKRDSGILYHCYGDHGAFCNVWKHALEFQVQEYDMGNLIALTGPRVQAPYRRDGKHNFYDPRLFFAEWSGYLFDTKEPDAPDGHWNTLEVYAIGNSAIHVLNGEIVVSLKGVVDHHGLPLTRGQLQIQSQAAEVYYKNLRIRTLIDFPERLNREASL